MAYTIEKIACPRLNGKNMSNQEVFVLFDFPNPIGVMCNSYVEERDECKMIPNQPCLYSQWEHFPKE